MSHLIGQVAKGCLADLVLWKPENFGAKPEMIVKGGFIAWGTVSSWKGYAKRSRLTDYAAQMGEANGSIPTVQPIYGRPMWAAEASSAGMHSLIWASKASIDNGMHEFGAVRGISLNMVESQARLLRMG